MASDSLPCIVVVNWNGRELLRRCLGSLYANTPMAKVVVVDNASTDDSVEMTQRLYPQAAIIRNSANLGFSKANNQGIRYALGAGAKNVLLLNNDVEVTSASWLGDFTAVLKSDSKIGVVGCKLLYPDGTIQHAGGVIRLRVPYNRGDGEADHGQYDRVEMVDYATGAALLIRADVIRRIGLLDEKFTPLYFEDTDWCARALLYGYSVAYSPQPTLIHHCGASSSKLGDEKKRFYAKRSLIRFFLLNYQLKDILKRIALYESREALRCLVVKPSHGGLPLTLRSDAANRLRLYTRAWMASIRDFRGIIYLRRQRFALGKKLTV